MGIPAGSAVEGPPDDGLRRVRHARSHGASGNWLGVADPPFGRPAGHDPPPGKPRPRRHVRRGVGRELLKGIINTFCYIGSLWSLFDANNEALYDKVITSNAYKAEKGGIMPIFPGGNPF